LVACGNSEIEHIEYIDNDTIEDTDIVSDIINLSFEDILEQALIRRQSIFRPDVESIMHLIDGRTPGSMPDGLSNSRNRVAVSVEEAIEDVNTFFEALRSVYGGYVYFGGDEVFLPIRDRIIERIALFDGTVRPGRFEEILIENLLPVINDSHFFIADMYFDTETRYFRIQNVEYDKTENGFRNRMTGLYLEGINGHEIYDLMRLYLDAEGGFYYSPVIRMDIPLSTEVLFLYENSEYVSRFWHIDRPNTRVSRPVDYPSLERIDGIPVITVMRMGSDGDEHAIGFMGLIDDVRDEDVIIIDLRFNRGGHMTRGFHWLYELLGEAVPSSPLTLFKHVEGDGSLLANPELSYDPEIFYGVDHLNEYYYLFLNHPDRIVESEKTLIFLIGTNTASAAEYFVGLSMNMTNTLVIGRSTVGRAGFGAGVTLYLPNSGVNFGFGLTVIKWPDNLYAEGAGIEPDIWVMGDALEAALALLSNVDFDNR